jgi:uncharacterized protein (DUF885 family)
MDRREFMIMGGAAFSVSLLGAMPVRAFAQAAPADGALNAIFERIFEEQVRTSPTLATSLGLDKGELASLRSKLDIRPTVQARAEETARTRKFISWLKGVPEGGLSDSAKLNREVVIWDLETSIVGPERFDISNPQSPYVITQKDGVYFSRPDFLNSAHPIGNASDAEAYLSRL